MQKATNIDLQNTILIVAFIMLLLICFIGLVLVLFYYKRKKQEIELKKQFSQTLLQSQIEIQEQTLQHISRELHDNLGQVASLIKINLLTIDLTDTEKTIDKMENTKTLIRQLIADIKNLSVSLNGDRLLQDGLAKALESEIDQLNKTGQFVACFSLEGAIPLLNKDKAVILYRMSQEVLNNMVKHSLAQEIGLAVSVTHNLLILIFSDNGVGFNVTEKMNCNGAGLRNLQSRAKLINAKLNIESLPMKGTKVEIEFPL